MVTEVYDSGEKMTTETIKILNEISAATIDRIFKPIKHRYKKRGLCTTKPGSIIKELVPIKTNQWDERRPDFWSRYSGTLWKQHSRCLKMECL